MNLGHVYGGQCFLVSAGVNGLFPRPPKRKMESFGNSVAAFDLSFTAEKIHLWAAADGSRATRRGRDTMLGLEDEVMHDIHPYPDRLG